MHSALLPQAYSVGRNDFHGALKKRLNGGVFFLLVLDDSLKFFGYRPLSSCEMLQWSSSDSFLVCSNREEGGMQRSRLVILIF